MSKPRIWSGLAFIISSSILLCSLLAGCTATREYRKGIKYEEAGEYDQAIAHYEKALIAKPDDIEIRTRLESLRSRAAQKALQPAREAFTKGKFDHAEKLFLKALSYQPANAEALYYLEKIEKLHKRQQLIASIQNLIKEGKYENAKELLTQLNSISPGEPVAAGLGEQLNKALSGAASGSSALSPLQHRLAFVFKDAPMSAVLDSISDASGITILYDDSVGKKKVSVNIKETTVEKALEYLVRIYDLIKEEIDPYTILLVENNAINRKKLAREQVKSFALNYLPAEDMLRLLKPLVPEAAIAVNSSNNIIVMRGTPRALSIAQSIIEANDRRRLEVLVDVELLEVNRSLLRSIGSDLGKSPIIKGSIITPSASGESSTASGIPLSELLELDAESFVFELPDFYVRLLRQHAASRLLANPRIRILSGEQASLHIGDKVPIETTRRRDFDTNEEVFSYEYKDVGIKLSIKPFIHNQEETTLHITVEVSSIVDNATTTSPTIGTRNLETTLRLKDGQTEVIAGLIRDDERITHTQIPLLGSIPLMGSLFSSSDRDVRETEIVMTLRPVIRHGDESQDKMTELWSGKPLAYTSDLGTLRSEKDATTLQVPEAIPSAALPEGIPSPAKIYLAPSTRHLKPGETTNLLVKIENATDVNSISFYLEFTPQVLEVTSVQEGDFLAKDGVPTTFLHSLDTELGRLIIGNARLSTEKGADGKGTIMTLELKALRDGSSRLVFTNGLLLGSQGALPVSFTPGKITVTQ